MVSICCLTYNQEAYIAQTLQSFMDQVTDFPFEVLIHDDASTDKTADIIRQFEAKYPDIIKPIYQTENQHSKNVRISFTYQYPRATGKYIAMCEGDDYWIDPHKLQKQVDYMEAHPDCTLCFTNGQCERNGKLSGRIVPWVDWNRKAYIPGDADYDMGQMVLLDYVATASLLFRTQDILSIPILSPNSFQGDTFIRLYLTSLGFAHCIDEDTCVYRFGVANSATSLWHKDPQKSITFLNRMQSLLHDMDHITQHRYNDQIQQMLLRLEFKKGMAQENYAPLRTKTFHKLYRSDGSKAYIKYLLNVYLPRTFQKLQYLKRKISNK